MHRITFYPLGNADSYRIDLESGRKLLFDFADRRDAVNLPDLLRQDLKAAGRDAYDVVAFTHLDADHIAGSSEFFHLDHAEKYQGDGRIKIKMLWVPAAVIVETGNTDEDRIIQAEARHRLRKGYGIRVFSRPDVLKDWLAANNLTLADRSRLITDAGQLVPEFSKEAEGVEFFVHSPFASRLEDGSVMDRNKDCLVLQATFLAGGSETKFMMTADVEHEVLSEIVRITKLKNRESRLAWDLFKLPHHCSYLSLSSEKGKEKTVPVPNVDWLFKQGRSGGLIISTSKPIPDGYDDVQPPHRQAANYHKERASAIAGRFVVTMEHPTESEPEPMLVTIDGSKATLKLAVTSGAAGAVSRHAPRAG